MQYDLWLSSPQILALRPFLFVQMTKQWNQYYIDDIDGNKVQIESWIQATIQIGIQHLLHFYQL
jgi:hypothetical protein